MDRLKVCSKRISYLRSEIQATKDGMRENKNHTSEEHIQYMEQQIKNVQAVKHEIECSSMEYGENQQISLFDFMERSE